MITTVVLDGGWRTTREAEHALHETAARLGLRPRTACTGFLREPSRVAVTVEWEPSADRAACPGQAAGPVLADFVDRAADSVAGPLLAAYRYGSAGRAFIFPGSTTLTGVVPVGDVLAGTAISDVLALGGVPVGPATALDTQDFVRPEFRDGRLILLTRPAAGHVVVPFEQPNPTPCCADHP